MAEELWTLDFRASFAILININQAIVKQTFWTELMKHQKDDETFRGSSLGDSLNEAFRLDTFFKCKLLKIELKKIYLPNFNKDEILACDLWISCNLCLQIEIWNLF